ncbi:hypothetical protein GCM10027176_65710 [Actinoallomurus bryophytorum]
MDWPEADEEKLFAAAEAVAHAGEGATEAGTSGDIAFAAVKACMDGVAADSFGKYWDQFNKTDPQYLPKLTEACNEAAKQLHAYGLDAEYTKYMILFSLMLLAYQIVYFITMAAPSFGTSLSLIPGACAITQMSVRQLARQLLVNILMSTAIMGGMDWGIQSIQMIEGNRRSWDFDKTLASLEGGVMTGAAFTGMAGLLGKIGGSRLASAAAHDLKFGELTGREKFASFMTNSVGGHMLQSGAANMLGSLPMLAASGQLDLEHLAKAGTSGLIGAADGHLIEPTSAAHGSGPPPGDLTLPGTHPTVADAGHPVSDGPPPMDTEGILAGSYEGPSGDGGAVVPAGDHIPPGENVLAGENPPVGGHDPGAPQTVAYDGGGQQVVAHQEGGGPHQTGTYDSGGSAGTPHTVLADAGPSAADGAHAPMSGGGHPSQPFAADGRPGGDRPDSAPRPGLDQEPSPVVPVAPAQGDGRVAGPATPGEGGRGPTSTAQRPDPGTAGRPDQGGTPRPDQGGAARPDHAGAGRPDQGTGARPGEAKGGQAGAEPNTAPQPGRGADGPPGRHGDGRAPDTPDVVVAPVDAGPGGAGHTPHAGAARTPEEVGQAFVREFGTDRYNRFVAEFEERLRRLPSDSPWHEVYQRMPKELLAAVHAYTRGWHRDLNVALREGSEAALAEQSAHIEALKVALDGLPRYDGIAHRGADLTSEQLKHYLPHTVVKERAFTSATTSLHSRLPGNTHFVIQSRNGREIGPLATAMGHEREVIFAPDTEFKVLGVDQRGDTTVIYLTEVEASPSSPFQIIVEQGRPGDGYVAPGVWGKHGASSGLIRHTDATGTPRYLLQQAGPMVREHEGKWQLPGGARNSLETPAQGFAREFSEESGADQRYLDTLSLQGERVVEGPNGFTHTTMAIDSPTRFEPRSDGLEATDAKWFTEEELKAMAANGDLHPKLAESLQDSLNLFPGHDPAHEGTDVVRSAGTTHTTAHPDAAAGPRPDGVEGHTPAPSHPVASHPPDPASSHATTAGAGDHAAAGHHPLPAHEEGLRRLGLDDLGPRYRSTAEDRQAIRDHFGEERFNELADQVREARRQFDQGRLSGHDDWAPVLERVPIEDQVALYSYTTDPRVNEAMRTGDLTALEHWAPVIKGITSALNEMPVHTDMVFRRIWLQPHQLHQLDVYQPGVVIREPAYISASSDARAKLGGNVEFVIDSRTGRLVAPGLHARPQEREVVLMPDRHYKVLDTEDLPGGGKRVYLRELTDVEVAEPVPATLRPAEAPHSSIADLLNGTHDEPPSPAPLDAGADRPVAAPDAPRGPVHSELVGRHGGEAVDAAVSHVHDRTQGGWQKTYERVETEDLASSRLFAQGDHRPINEGLYGGHEEALAPYTEQIRSHDAVLEQLPAFEGRVHRVVDLDPAQQARYRQVEVAHEPGYVIGSANPHGQFHGNTEFVIESRTGRLVGPAITDHGTDHEVHFRRDTDFEVTGVEDLPDGRLRVYQREMTDADRGPDRSVLPDHVRDLLDRTGDDGRPVFPRQGREPLEHARLLDRMHALFGDFAHLTPGHLRYTEALTEAARELYGAAPDHVFTPSDLRGLRHLADLSGAAPDGMIPRAEVMLDVAREVAGREPTPRDVEGLTRLAEHLDDMGGPRDFEPPADALHRAAADRLGTLPSAETTHRAIHDLTGGDEHVRPGSGTPHAGTRERDATAANVGDFRGDAIDPSEGSLTRRDVLNEIVPNIRLIAPKEIRWAGDHFVLPDGRDITIETGRTEDDAVASFSEDPDGYRITVSPQARPEDVVRGVGHEVEEIRLRNDPDVVHDISSETPTQMTDHLGGRFAEVRILSHQIDRAVLDPSRAGDLPRLTKDLRDLTERIGLHDHPTADDRLRLLAEYDPALAHRFELQSQGLFQDRPIFDPRLTEPRYAEQRARYLDRLREVLQGDRHMEEIVYAESAALDGRMRMEQSRRVFDPIFEGAKERFQAAGRGKRAVFEHLEPITAAMSDRHIPPAERHAAIDAVIERMRAVETGPRPVAEAMLDRLRAVSEIPPALIDAIDFDAMREAARDSIAAPYRSAGALDHASGNILLNHDLPGAPAGSRVPFRELLAVLDRANQGFAERGVHAEYAVVIHDPVDGQSHIDVLSRPRPQHRQDAVGHSPRPPAPAAARGGHTIDVGVGRSGYAAEMTPAADRQGGGLIIQTELPDAPLNGLRRRDIDIMDPAPLTGDGSVLVFGDLLSHGQVLAHGENGGVARVYLNNVSAKFTHEQYARLGDQFIGMMSEGGRVEVQWDMKPEKAGGTPGDRGHVQGDILVDVLRERGADISVTNEEFGVQGNDDYDYSIDAATRNDPDQSVIETFASPRPQFRTVIEFLSSPERGGH